MSSKNTKSDKGRRKLRNHNLHSEEELSNIAGKYNIEYKGDKEKLITNLALKGQEYLNNQELEKTEEICVILFSLAKEWKDNFAVMKSNLLKAQLYSAKKQNPLPFLYSGLKSAKRLKIDEIVIGIHIQIAFEKIRRQEYKGVLKEIKAIEKYSVIIEENSRVISELKARSYWELDDYKKGFEATLLWFEKIKNRVDDLYSLFMVIVYLLTVLSSIKLPYSEEKINEIKNEIKNTLTQLATSSHVLKDIIPNLDILFAKSLMLVEPDILHEFAELILQTARWNDEEKYLILCQKLADSFYNINDFDKAIKLVDKAIQYAREKKYAKIEPLLQFKKVELTSLIFYFVPFDPLFDPFSIESIEVIQEKETKKWNLNVIQAPVNSFPSTSYSQFLRILEKATSKYDEESWINIKGISDSEERCFFVLRLKLAEEIIDILMKEDFRIEKNISQTLHSTVSPYYSVIGVLTEQNAQSIHTIEKIEEKLLKIQRGINCPASTVQLIFPKNPPQLNLYRFFMEDKNFGSLKVKLFDSAFLLRKKYDFVKNYDFLQIFRSDPITIFDLALREPNELLPLSHLIKHAYGIQIELDVLAEFFKDMMKVFLQSSETRFWKDFYYQYAWLQLKGEYLSLSNEYNEKKMELSKKLIELSKKTGENQKLLESNYFYLLSSILSDVKSFKEKFREFKELLKGIEDEKYSIIVSILENLNKESKDFNDELLLASIDKFCEFCEFEDWDKTLELFVLLLDKIPNISTLTELCKKRELKDTGFLMYLNLTKHLISQEDYHSAFQMLNWILQRLSERRTEFFYPQHTWNYFFVTANQFLYEILEKISETELKEAIITKEVILENLLENHEWITDPILLVKLLREETELLIDKSDISLAESTYHWIEQLMFYSWDIFTSQENRELLKKVQDTKKRIVSQHFI